MPWHSDFLPGQSDFDKERAMMCTAVPLPAQLTVSAIVPAHNDDENLRRCLQSIIDASSGADEVLVVFDGKIKDHASLENEFGVSVIQTHAVRGPARARNIGAKAANGSILLFIDSDVAIQPDSISKVRDIFNSDPGITAVFGSYDDAPDVPSFTSQYRNLLHHYVHQMGREEASTFWTGYGAIRRDEFLKNGGFNEFLYPTPSIEDVELGCRLAREGRKIRLCKDLQVKHLKGWGGLSILKTDLFSRALPWTQMILRDRSLGNDLNLNITNRISVMLVLGLVASMPAIAFWLGAAVVSGIFAASLLVINMPLYVFFGRRRGLLFAIGTIPWHWIHYLCSGLGFMVGFGLYVGQLTHSATVGKLAKFSETDRQHSLLETRQTD